MKTLRVGDVHAKASNLEDTSKLLDFVLQQAVEQKVSHIELLGDLFDTHLVMRLDVMNFWQSFVHKVDAIGVKTIAIVGNHDMMGDKQRERSMSALDSLKYISPYFTVVDKPTVINNIAYMPYFSDEKEFILEALKLTSAKTLVCHQTFNGAMFDNGMYAPHGFNVDMMKDFDQVICGHIHSYQRFSNILYIGTPRWESLSDANENKGIWLFEDSKEPLLISTAEVCQPINLYEFAEGDMIKLPPTTAKNYFVLKGSSSWIAKTSKTLKGLGKITPRPTDTKNVIENRQEKISSLESYAIGFPLEKGIETQDILNYIGSL